MFSINLSDIQYMGIALNELILTTIVMIIIFAITFFLMSSGKMTKFQPLFKYALYIVFIITFVCSSMTGFISYEIEAKRAERNAGYL
jgi:hypothetical protein